MNLQEMKYTLFQNQKQTKYIKWYFNIIEKALSEDRKWYNAYHKDKDYYTYYERHHILPKSIFKKYGNWKECEWNKVVLTPKEHFMVHMCIWKHYKSIGYTYGEKKMSYAIQCFKMGDNRYNSKQYHNLKFNFKLDKSQRERIIVMNKGRKHTEEARKKMSNARKGKKHSPETIQKMKDNGGNRKKEYIIYDNYNKFNFFINKGFRVFCEENDLPCSAFRHSYRNNGKKLYQHFILKSHETKTINNGWIKYKGWYAIDISKLKFRLSK